MRCLALCNSQHLCICTPTLQCQHLRSACLQVLPVGSCYHRKPITVNKPVTWLYGGDLCNSAFVHGCVLLYISYALLLQDSLLCCYKQAYASMWLCAPRARNRAS